VKDTLARDIVENGDLSVLHLHCCQYFNWVVSFLFHIVVTDTKVQPPSTDFIYLWFLHLYPVLLTKGFGFMYLLFLIYVHKEEICFPEQEAHIS
jgi:hypothetical protein